MSTEHGFRIGDIVRTVRDITVKEIYGREEYGVIVPVGAQGKIVNTDGTYGTYSLRIYFEPAMRHLWYREDAVEVVVPIEVFRQHSHLWGEDTYGR